MIAHVEGILTLARGGRAHLVCGPVTLECLVATSDEERLAGQVGKRVALHTMLYLEGAGGGTSFAPRMIGFLDAEDRAFFELFTTVKGMGNKKALRALALPFGAVARAIADKDIDLLRSLPEIGKRTAETIVAELHGKVDQHIELKPAEPGSTGGEESSLVNDVTSVLVQLGESRLDARSLIEKAIAANPELDTAESLIEAVYQIKSS